LHALPLTSKARENKTVRRTRNPMLSKYPSLINCSSVTYNFISDTKYTQGVHGIKNLRGKFPGIGKINQRYTQRTTVKREKI